MKSAGRYGVACYAADGGDPVTSAGYCWCVAVRRLGLCNEALDVHADNLDPGGRSRRSNLNIALAWCACVYNWAHAGRSPSHTRGILFSWFSDQYEERYTPCWCKR